MSAIQKQGDSMEETKAPARPPFKVSGMASIKHLNVRKEGPEDEKILACDIKLEIKNVDRRLCGYFDEALEAFLWRGETDALIVRNIFLAPVSYGNSISSAHVRIGSDSFVGCEVKKFAVEPRDGGVINLYCSVSVYPSSNDVSGLARLVQEDANVVIEGPPDLFASGEVDAAPAQEPAAPEAEATEADSLYEQALSVVLERRLASISLVQRRLRIGYNRASQLLEEMEQRGAVSAMDDSGARKILVATGAAQ